MKRIVILMLCMAMLCLVGCEASDNASSTSEVTPSSTLEIPEVASEGLVYEINAEGTACVITGIGDCEDTFIVIPDSIEDCPVTEIAASAFYCQEDLRGIRLGANVTKVGDYALFGCTALEMVLLNDGLEQLGSYVFSGCGKIAEITIPDSIMKIGAWAFFECLSLKAVNISDLNNWYTLQFDGIYANPLMLAGTLYVDGEVLTELMIPEDLTQIGEWSFAGCKSLTTVRIHENVTVIGQRAFLDCESLTTIVYDGTAEQWKQIVLGTYWDFSVEELMIECQDKEIKG